MSDIFERASKLKLRFSSNKGLLSVEDLWDLSLNSLDSLAKGVNKNVKASQEDSFLSSATTRVSKALSEDSLRLDILKSIIASKEVAAEKAKNRAVQLVQANRVKELIAQKQDEALSGKSLEELNALLASVVPQDESED